MVLEAGRQFLDVHLNRTFARNTEYVLVGSGEFRTQRIRQAYAHRTQAAGIEPLARAFERIILRREHLVLPHVRSDDSGIAGNFGKFLHDILRLDDFAVVVKPQAVARTPFFDVFPPFIQRVSGRRILFAPQGNHFGQDVFHIADNRNIDFDAFGDAGRVNINMNDFFGFFKEFGRNGDDTVVKTRTHCQYDICVLHGEVGFVSAVHTQHAQELAVA